MAPVHYFRIRVSVRPLLSRFAPWAVILLTGLGALPAAAEEIIWDQTDANAIEMVCAFRNGYKLTPASSQSAAGCYWRSWSKTHIVTPPANMDPRDWGGLTLMHILEHECKHAYKGNWHRDGENGDESDLGDYAHCANELLATGHSYR